MVLLLLALESGEVKLSDYKLDQWRLMHIGAQPVPQSLIKRWKEYFPHHQYDTNYGLSESIGPGAVHLGVENIDKVGAIGVPGYGWQVRIVDEDGKDVKQGDVGELILKGPGVMTCYYKNPEATAETLKDGWLYTGDMAEQDADGFIYLVDRKKDDIISGGENIYPVQIENFLSKYPKIKDVAVIGLADPRLGEITAAIIEKRMAWNVPKMKSMNFVRNYQDIRDQEGLFLRMYREMQQVRSRSRSFVRSIRAITLLQPRIMHKEITDRGIIQIEKAESDMCSLQTQMCVLKYIVGITKYNRKVR